MYSKMMCLAFYSRLSEVNYAKIKPPNTCTNMLRIRSDREILEFPEVIKLEQRDTEIKVKSVGQARLWRAWSGHTSISLCHSGDNKCMTKLECCNIFYFFFAKWWSDKSDQSDPKATPLIKGKEASPFLYRRNKKITQCFNHILLDIL